MGKIVNHDNPDKEKKHGGNINNFKKPMGQFLETSEDLLQKNSLREAMQA
jgi:hypothetical protein